MHYGEEVSDLESICRSLLRIIWIYQSMWRIKDAADTFFMKMSSAHAQKVEEEEEFTCGEILKELKTIELNLEYLPRRRECELILKEVREWIQRISGEEATKLLSHREWKNLKQDVKTWRDCYFPSLCENYRSSFGIPEEARPIIKQAPGYKILTEKPRVLVKVGEEEEFFEPPFVIGRVSMGMEDRLGIRVPRSSRLEELLELSQNPENFPPLRVFRVQARAGCVPPDEDCTSRIHLLVYQGEDNKIHIMDLSRYGSMIRMGGRKLLTSGGRSGEEVTLSPGETAEVRVKGVKETIYIQVSGS